MKNQDKKNYIINKKDLIFSQIQLDFINYLRVNYNRLVLRYKSKKVQTMIKILFY